MDSAKQLLESLRLIQRDEKVLVAFSGGRDSVALARFLNSEGWKIALAHVNYGLRGEESQLDAEFCQQFAKNHGVKFHLKTVDSSEFENCSIQEKAREIRYLFFQDLCLEFGYSKIALAHHSADQMETFFLNLLRGTGIKGLSGMPISRDNIVRPLIHTSRQEVDEYIKKHNLNYRNDASNNSDKYTRNRIRHNMIPMLDDLLENGENRIKSSLDRIQSDVLAMSEMAKNLLLKTELGWEIDLNSIPIPGRETWVYHSLRDFSFNRTQCSNLVNSSPGAEIKSGHYTAAIFNQTLIIRDTAVPFQLEIDSIGTFPVSKQKNLKIELLDYAPNSLPTSKSHVWLDADEVHFPLKLRTIIAEDQFRPLGCDYSVKVNRYLKDRQMNRLDRPQQLVLSDPNNDVLWVCGIQIADRPKCSEKTKRVLSLQIF
jgi:tRNA(Ile)-lysidine synthase